MKTVRVNINKETETDKYELLLQILKNTPYAFQQGVPVTVTELVSTNLYEVD